MDTLFSLNTDKSTMYHSQDAPDIMTISCMDAPDDFVTWQYIGKDEIFEVVEEQATHVVIRSLSEGIGEVKALCGDSMAFVTVNVEPVETPNDESEGSITEEPPGTAEPERVDIHKEDVGLSSEDVLVDTHDNTPDTGTDGGDTGTESPEVPTLPEQGDFEAIISPDKGFKTLAEALAAVTPGDTVILLKDISVSAVQKITKNLTLDLNGHVIHSESTEIPFILQIYGPQEVAIVNTSEELGCIDSETTAGIMHYSGTLTLRDIYVETEGVDGKIPVHSWAYNGDTVLNIEGNTQIVGNNGFGVVLYGSQGGTFRITANIRDGDIYGKEVGVTGQGNYDSIDLNVSGGKIAGDIAMYLPQEGTNLKISGGEILGKCSGIQFAGSGDLKITGGSIICDGPYTPFPSKDSSQSDGSTNDGAALSFISRNGYQNGKPINALISGGYLESLNNATIAIYRMSRNSDGTWQVNTPDVPQELKSLKITGGTFITKNNKDVIDIDPAAEEALVISGGHFRDDQEVAVLSRKFLEKNHLLYREEEGTFEVRRAVISQITSGEKVEKVTSLIPGDTLSQVQKMLVESITESGISVFPSGIALSADFAGVEKVLEENLVEGKTLEDITSLDYAVTVSLLALLGEGTPESALTLRYEVVPIVIGYDTSNTVISTGQLTNDVFTGKDMTFVLPIPPSVIGYAQVEHIYGAGRDSLVNISVQELNGEKYIQITTKHFSQFEVTFTEQPVQKSSIAANPTITLELDTTAPTGASLQLGDGVPIINNQLVILNITLPQGLTDVFQMKIWGDVDPAYHPGIQPAEEDTAWITYDPKKQIKLSAGDALKIIYCQLRDDVLNEGDVVSVTVSLDLTEPVVAIISGPTPRKISKIKTKNFSDITFIGSEIFVEYKVCVVSATSEGVTAAVPIGTQFGSVNMAGTGQWGENDTISCSINGADLEAASPGDGMKIVKIFIKDRGGNWSK